MQRNSVLAITWAIVALPTQVGAQQRIPDDILCRSCTIDARLIVRLGSVEGAGFLSGIPSSVDVDARGRYWVFMSDGLPEVFQATGSHAGTIGSPGRGPLELGRPAFAMRAVADSVVLFDQGVLKAVVIDPGLRPAREVSLPFSPQDAYVISWPDSVVISSMQEGRDGLRAVLQSMSLASSQAVVSTIDEFERLPAQQRTGAPVRLSSQPRGDSIWAIHYMRYDVRLLVHGARLALHFQRRPSWFPADSDGGLGSPTRPPSPHAAAVEPDASGRVWTFINVAAPTWREGWPAGGRGGDLDVRALHLEKFFMTRVEVLDPVARRVVARADVPGATVSVLPDQRVALYDVDAEGIPSIRVMQLTLRGGRAGRE
jgi:hypothetical protein